MKTKNHGRYPLVVVTAFSVAAAATILVAQSQKPLAAPPEKEKSVNKMSALEDRKETRMKGNSQGVHDFDFFMGNWRVHHRRLTDRLVNSHDWVEFDGTSASQKVLGGYGNMDDNTLDLPDGPYRAVTLRAYDPKTNQWSIWWLDSRYPGQLDPPVVGRFENGVGTFYANDTFKGKPIRVRFLWTRVTSATPHWEQAFSIDAGESWETNWTMDFTKAL